MTFFDIFISIIHIIGYFITVVELIRFFIALLTKTRFVFLLEKIVKNVRYAYKEFKMTVTYTIELYNFSLNDLDFNNAIENLKQQLENKIEFNSKVKKEGGQLIILIFGEKFEKSLLANIELLFGSEERESREMFNGVISVNIITKVLMKKIESRINDISEIRTQIERIIQNTYSGNLKFGSLYCIRMNGVNFIRDLPTNLRKNAEEASTVFILKSRTKTKPRIVIDLASLEILTPTIDSKTASQIKELIYRYYTPINLFKRRK